MLNPTPVAFDQFGYAVASVGSDVLIGAYLDDTGAFNSGAVYRFSVAADLAPLAGLQSLEVLSLAGQGVEDIRALNGLVNLDYLYLHDNAISDIDGLLGLSIRDNTDAGFVETGAGWTGGDNAAAYGDTTGDTEMLAIADEAGFRRFKG